MGTVKLKRNFMKYGVFVPVLGIVLFVLFQNSTPAPLTNEYNDPLAHLSMCQKNRGPVAVAIMSPGEMKGVKTKRLSFKPDQDTPSYLLELQPPHFNQTWTGWYRRLTENGINTAELRLEYHKHWGEILVEPKINSANWATYIDEVMKPMDERIYNGNGESMVDHLGYHIKNNHFTELQRRQILLRFLSQIEKVRLESGQTPEKLGFVMSDLQWINNSAEYDQDIAALAEEMSLVINDAKRLCLDHLISGLHVYELTNYNANDIMQITLKFSAAVNLKTGNWLKKRMLIMGGGGKGAFYKGFDTAGTSLDFYENLKPQVGSFAWGYKFFENDKSSDSIRMKMKGSVCSVNSKNQPVYCNVNSVADWKYFLNAVMGFNDLANLIKTYKSNHRSLANVVFVGDSSDTINQMVDENGPLSSYIALAELFQEASVGTASAFLGKHMIDAFGGDAGYQGSDRASCPGQNLMTILATDEYQSGIKMMLMTPTYEFWSQWPKIPAVTGKLPLDCNKNL